MKGLADQRWGIRVNGTWRWFTVAQLLAIARRSIEAEEATCGR